MTALRKYLAIHCFLTLSIILYIFLIKIEFLQYAVIFIGGLLVPFIIVTVPRVYRLSVYLKNRHKDIYDRNLSFRKYMFKDVWAVNIFSIKETELKTIADNEVTLLVKELKLVHKIAFATLVLCILLLAIRAYL